MKPILETKRLTLREFAPTDAAFVLQLVNMPSWVEFIGDKNIRTKKEAQSYIEDSLMQSYKKNGFGLWLMQHKETSEPIGMCGLVNRDSLDAIDIGFALLTDYARKGYTYEAAKATMEYAKNTLGIPKIVAITDTKNVASIGLLNKIGLQFEKELQLTENDTVLLFS